MDKKHLPINDPAGAKRLRKLYRMTEDAAIEAKAWDGKGRMPIEQWSAAQELLLWCDQHEAGDKSAVLHAMYLCLLNDLPVPNWAAMGYLKAFRDVRHYRAKKWADVFGPAHAKGTHVDAKSKERNYSLEVYMRVAEGNEPISPELFERIGLELGIGGKTLTEEYYYKWKKRLENK